MSKRRSRDRTSSGRSDKQLLADLTRGFQQSEPAQVASRRRRLTAKSLRKGRIAWSFRVHDQDGDRRTVTIPFAECATLRAALNRANEIAAKLNPESKPTSTTFAAYVARLYWPDVAPSLGDDTQRAVGSVLRKHAIPRFVDCRLSAVGPRLQAWIDEQRDAGEVVSTIQQRVRVVKAVLAAAREIHGLDVGRLPTRLRWPSSNRVRHTHAQVTFSASQEQQLVAAARGAERAAYRLGLVLGLRPSEITGLAWQHVDLDARVLTVAQQARRGEVVAPKTEASHAVLDLPDGLLAELRALRATDPAATFVLASPGRPDEPMRTAFLRARLASLCASLEIPPKGLHGLRRRFADALLEAGTPIDDIQGALRHANLETTIRYLSHARRPAIAAAIRAAAERFLAGERDAVVVELATRRRSSTPTKIPKHD